MMTTMDKSRSSGTDALDSSHRQDQFLPSIAQSRPAPVSADDYPPLGGAVGNRKKARSKKQPPPLYSPLHGDWLEWRLSQELILLSREEEEEQGLQVTREPKLMNKASGDSGGGFHHRDGNFLSKQQLQLQQQFHQNHDSVSVAWREVDGAFTVSIHTKDPKDVQKELSAGKLQQQQHQQQPQIVQNSSLFEMSVVSSREQAQIQTSRTPASERRRKVDILLSKKAERSKNQHLEDRLHQLREAHSLMATESSILSSLGPEDSSILSLCKSLASGMSVSASSLRQQGRIGLGVSRTISSSVELSPIDWKLRSAVRDEKHRRVHERKQLLDRSRQQRLQLQLTDHRIAMKEERLCTQVRQRLAMKVMCVAITVENVLRMGMSARKLRERQLLRNAAVSVIQKAYRAHVMWNRWMMLKQSTRAVRFATQRLRICASRAREVVRNRKKNEAVELLKAFLSTAGTLLATSAMRLFRRRVIRCQNYVREYLFSSRLRISLFCFKWSRVEAQLDLLRMRQYQKRLLEMKSFDMVKLNTIIKGLEASRRCDRDQLERIAAMRRKAEAENGRWRPGHTMQDIREARHEAEVMVKRGMKFKVIPSKLSVMLLRRLLRSIRLDYKVTYWTDQVVYMERQRQEMKEKARRALESSGSSQSGESKDHEDELSEEEEENEEEEQQLEESDVDIFDRKVRERLEVIIARRKSRPPGLLPFVSFSGTAWYDLVILAERCIALGVKPLDAVSPLKGGGSMTAGDIKKALILHSSPLKSSHQVEKEAQDIITNCYGLSWEEISGSDPPKESLTLVAPQEAVQYIENDIFARICTPLSESEK